MSKPRGDKKSVEETYQKLSPIQHVLKRPDTYVGSIEKQPETQWILNPDETQFLQKTVSFSPALYKIYDEILVNAADNYQRDKSMDYLSIEINAQQGFIKVHNNGKGIPVVMHKTEAMYVPEMIFGHLLTGSNYDDNEKRLGGGRNGYGAKLANIFSRKFIVECGDSQNRKSFRMVWTDNMGKKAMPEINPFKMKDFVQIVFYPDFKKFNMLGFDDDIVSLFRKRVFDLAGVLPKVRVHLNGKLIKMRSFSDYVDMYLGKGEDDEKPIKILDKDSNNNTWEVIISRSSNEPQQVSFVNAICTYKGGTHVNSVLDQIIPKIAEKIKSANVKAHQIKSKLFVFVNCLIENPTFDSQVKETLTTKPSSFGSKWEATDKIIKAILNTKIVEELMKEDEARQQTKMAKATANGKKARIDVPKLEDANDAGTRKSELCTLILTEGDSAKALAVAGLSVVGRDTYGVFPLRGKLLNVRQKDKKAVMENVELKNLVKILGLQYSKEYTDLKSLRYGSIMIMTDQDADGSHIKGLIINFIQYYWPSLFKHEGFLRQFITPLLKATKGSDVKSFFTIQEFKAWANTIVNPKTWKVKYYKGLGTSTNKEAQEYFKNLQLHEKVFQYENSTDDIKIDLVFSKKKADERKEWLAHYNPDDIIEFTRDMKIVSYKDFVDKEMIHFSNANNRRAIPSVMDGLKPGQRKVLFACFKRNLKEEIKVAQLAGYVAEHSAYHHGEQALTETIIFMAQNYVGSNNINLLMPNGQFGSRSEGGDDHASARYVFTVLSKITRAIFPEPDDHILKYLEDDGQIVEPEFYCPIIPMILVNGCEGMGTGWSTKIPNHNPREICELMRKRMRGQDFVNILPWYKNFTGETVENPGGVTFRGTINEGEGNTIHVTELPIGKWTVQFKEMLNELITKEDHVVGFREYHTQDRVHFEIDFEPGYLDRNTRYPENGPAERDLDHVFSFLKLSSKKCLTNMVAFEQSSHIFRYTTARDIMETFYQTRLAFYTERKNYLLSRLRRDVEITGMKCRFIVEVVDSRLEVRNKKKKELVVELDKKGFTRYSNFTKVKSTKRVPPERKPKNDEDEKESEEEEGEAAQGSISFKQFDYLLKLSLWNLTYERVEAMKADLKQKDLQYKELDETSQMNMWSRDIDEFLRVLDEVEAEEEIERRKATEATKDAQAKNKKKPGKKIAKKINSDSDTEDNPKPKRQRKSESGTETDNKREKSDKKGKGGGQKKDKSKESQHSNTKSDTTKNSEMGSQIKTPPTPPQSQPTLDNLFSKYGVNKDGKGDVSKKLPLGRSYLEEEQEEQKEDENSGVNRIKKPKSPFEEDD